MPDVDDLIDALIARLQAAKTGSLEDVHATHGLNLELAHERRRNTR